jgi:hypothetical protein
LLHQQAPPDPARWNQGTNGGSKREAKHDAWCKYKSVRQYLAKEHAEDVVLGIREKSFTQAQLVNKILETGYNSEPGNEWGGFICITGGKETRTDDDLLPGSFGFCHQRVGLREEEIGNFTKFQARLLQPEADAETVFKTLKALAAQPRTLVKTSFSEEGEVLALDYFRFLVQERGLSGYRVRHFVYYAAKKYTTPYIEGMIQRRHDLKFLVGSFVLLSILLKLVINGFFGFMALEAPNFPRTRLVTETTLKNYTSKMLKRKRTLEEDDGGGGGGGGGGRAEQLTQHQAKKCKLSVTSGNVYEMSLIGVVSATPKTSSVTTTTTAAAAVAEEDMTTDECRRPRGSGKRKKQAKSKPPDLLYSVTAHQPDQPIFNIAQASGTILGNSRVVFLGKIIVLLRAFNPGMMEIVYCVSTTTTTAVPWTLQVQFSLLIPGHGQCHPRRCRQQHAELHQARVRPHVRRNYDLPL